MLEDLLEADVSPITDGNEGSALMRVVGTGQSVTRVPGMALMYTETVLGAPPCCRTWSGPGARCTGTWCSSPSAGYPPPLLCP